jgi:hypothetical protein
VVGVEAGEDEDAAVRELAVYLVDEKEAVLAGHGDVAEQEVGLELAGLVQGMICRVSSLRVEAALLEDHREGVGYYMFVVYDQDSLHSAPSFLWRQTVFQEEQMEQIKQIKVLICVTDLFDRPLM